MRQELPVLLSIPHAGTHFPDEVADDFKRSLRKVPDDTDWFVDKLYDFAPELGVTTIAANISRWVIDLNRHPESKPLYHDGRIITALCPTTDFLGNPLYCDERKDVDPAEVERRIQHYFNPYHEQLQAELHRLRHQFGKVLLWDCHSIRQSVSTIHKDKFPDLILGDADGQSAATELTQIALRSLQQSHYRVSHNFPFKGGYITRAYGKPSQHMHALQLEMTKVNYMNDTELAYDENRALPVRTILQNTLRTLAEHLTS